MAASRSLVPILLVWLVQDQVASDGSATSVVFVNETEATRQILDELVLNETAIVEYAPAGNESELGEFQLLLPSPILDSGGENGGGVVWNRYAKAARMESDPWKAFESLETDSSWGNGRQTHGRRKHHGSVKHRQRAEAESSRRKKRRRLIQKKLTP